MASTPSVSSQHPFFDSGTLWVVSPEIDLGMVPRTLRVFLKLEVSGCVSQSAFSPPSRSPRVARPHRSRRPPPPALLDHATVTRPDGWVLEPAVQSCTVVGFIAWRDPTTVPEGSFAVVWHERNSDGTFGMKGFEDADPNSAAKYIALQLNDENLFSRSGLDIAFVNVGTAPKEIVNGLSIDDPLQPIALYLEPELMELVVSSGAAGAPDLSAQSVDLVPLGGTIEWSKLDQDLHFSAATIEVALCGELSAATLAATVTPAGALPDNCQDIADYGSWINTTQTATGRCIYAGTGARVCLTRGPGGTYTTTTTPTTTSCDCPAPLPAGTSCPAKPRCRC